MALMFTLAAVWIENTLKSLKKHWVFIFFCIAVSCYSCVCSGEWGGVHNAADHDDDLCKVIYSFIWPFFLLEPGRVQGTLSPTLLNLQQQICGWPGDSFTPNVWLYTERLADNKPLVHRWITTWGPRKACLLFFFTTEKNQLDSEPPGLSLESSRNGTEWKACW